MKMSTESKILLEKGNETQNKQKINLYKRNSFNDLKNKNDETAKKEPQGNQRYSQDTMQFTVEGLQRLKKDLEKKETTPGPLEIVGRMPPTQGRGQGATIAEKLKAVPNREKFSIRPPSASLRPTGPSLLNQQIRSKHQPLTLKAKDKLKAANLHKVGTASTDVSIAASKIYASAIQKAQEAVKAQEGSSSFVRNNYMNPTTKAQSLLSKTRRTRLDTRSAGPSRARAGRPTAINNDIEDVLGLSMSQSENVSEDEAPKETPKQDPEKAKVQQTEPENAKEEVENPQTPRYVRLQKEMVDIFNKKNNYSLEPSTKVKFNTSGMWKTFVEQRKGQQDPAAKYLPIHERTPKVPSLMPEDKIYSNRKMVDRVPPKELQPEAVFEIQKVNNSCRYDPKDENYIFKEKRLGRSNWNQRQYTAFGYNGNAPELVVSALGKRGCWKILNYQTLVQQQLKTQANRMRAKRDRSILSEQESRGYQSQQDKPNYAAIDETIVEKSHFVWRPVNYYDSVQRKIDRRMLKQNTSEPFVYNHLEVTKGIGSKSGLIKSLKQYYYTNQEARACGYSEFDTTPTTFIVNAKQCGPQLDELQIRFRQIQRSYPQKEKLPMKHCVNNLWLVKPSNANQGRGIQIFANWERMLAFINNRPGGTSCVVQKYIERPLLFKNRKFDIRVWAIATDRNELYFYRPGYLRTSSNQYSLDNGNLTVHLTNQCLQVKHKDTYGQHEEGNTLSYDAFQEYLDSEEFRRERELTIGGPEVQINVQRDLVPRMKDIVIDTFLSVKNCVNPNHRKNTFELFGYDFMIDEDFRVWLIEVNTNPYLGQPNKWTKQFVPEMVDELLQIVLDPIYPPVDKYYQEHRVKNKNYELIYAEGHITNLDYAVGAAAATGRVNQRRSFAHSLMYPKGIEIQQNPNALELKILRQKYKVGANAFGTPQQAAKNREKVQAFTDSSFSRRKRYRPASAMAHTTITSPAGRDSSKLEESHSRLPTFVNQQQIEKIGGKQEEQPVFYQPINYFTEPAQQESPKPKMIESQKSLKSIQIEVKSDEKAVLSPQIKKTSEPLVSKLESRSISLAQIERSGPPPKTPFVREVTLPDSSANLDHFFDLLRESKDGTKKSEQNFEQLSASAETSLVEFQKPETDSETNQTVIFDENAQVATAPANKLRKLVQNQICELIEGKLQDFYSSSPRSRTHKGFIDIFLSICQNYFVEQSQEDVQDPDEMQEMVQKFQTLIQSDLKGSISKPKCVDILIELLKNENTYAIENLPVIVLAQLKKISQSQSILDALDQPNDRPALPKDKVEPLSEHSVKAKEYLLKNQQIKKLLFVHEKLDEIEKGQLEELLINLTCITEARGLSCSGPLLKQLEALAVSAENQVVQPEVAAYRKYNEVFFRCTEIGLTSYLLSSNCLPSTNQFVLSKLNPGDMNLLLRHCDPTDDFKPQYLKIIERSVDMQNLKSRLRLQLKVVEETAKLTEGPSKPKEKKKELGSGIPAKAKKAPVPASVTTTQRQKNPEVVKAPATRDASINKLRRNYRPSTAAVSSPKPTTDVKPPKPALVATKKPKQPAAKKKKPIPAIPDKKPAVQDTQPKDTVYLNVINQNKQARPLSPKSTITLPKITNRSSNDSAHASQKSRGSVKQIQWNENMNQVSLKSADLPPTENPLDLALEKLESMKNKLMEKVQQSDINKVKKFENVIMKGENTKINK